MAVLGPRFFAKAFSSCGKRGPLFIAVHEPLTSRPLLLQGTGSRRAGSVVVAHGPRCSTVCGIFPVQGSNPCPLHWQVDSQPLRHQGSLRKLLISVKLNPVLFLSSSLFCVHIQTPEPLPCIKEGMALFFGQRIRRLGNRLSWTVDSSGLLISSLHFILMSYFQ